MVQSRLADPLPQGQLDEEHYRSIHRHLFQDVYDWSGRYRSIRTHKGETTFCYPEHIEREMRRLFLNLSAAQHFQATNPLAFAMHAAVFMGDLNAIHPFREGNGRVQQTFLVMLAAHANHDIDLRRVRSEPYLQAMIAAYMGDERPLAELIASWIV